MGSYIADTFRNFWAK